MNEVIFVYLATLIFSTRMVGDIWQHQGQLLHVVVQENVFRIVYFLHERWSRGQKLETHEHKRAEECGSVRTILENADDTVGTAKPLLSKVEQKYEALLASRLQDSR